MLEIRTIPTPGGTSLLATLLPLLLIPGPGSMQQALLASLAERFQGQVPASCTIDPLPASVALQTWSDRLVGETTSFRVNANAPVQLRVGRIQKLDWPQAATNAGLSEPIATVVGDGPHRIRLELIPPPGQLLPAGNYRVAVAVDCLLSAP